MMSQALIITGMHRSGTSLTASWLEKCGLTMFDKMPGDTGNELGHFEDLQIVKFHRAVIKRCCGKKSKGWLVNHKGELAFNEKEKEIAKTIYINKAEKGLEWGWKDPRTALFLYEWKKIFPEIKILCTWRPCLNVVDSLTRRSKKANAKVFKISACQAIKNWIIYNNKVLDFKSHYPDDIIIVPLDLIINRNNNFFEFMTQQFNFNFNYYSINNLYRSEMLKKDNKYSFPIEFFSKLFKCPAIEQNLILNSVKF